MLKLIIQLYKYEASLVLAYKAKGFVVMKPSTVLVTILAFFYALSPIDFIPEGLVNPAIFGYLDDTLLLIATTALVLSEINLGGVMQNVQQRRVPNKERDLSASRISAESERHKDIPDELLTASSSNSDSDVGGTALGSTVVPTSISTSDIFTDVKNDEFDDSYSDDDEDFFKELGK